MTTCVLAGDVGGTKTNLAIYSASGPGMLDPVAEETFHSHEFDGLKPMVAAFLGGHRERVSAAAFGVAGPVTGGVARTTNLPWTVDAQELAAAIGCPRVRLMNDLESTGYGALFVKAEGLLVLNPGTPQPGNRAVIAAGTGLGQGLLCWDGRRHYPSGSEGGHVDFGPQDEREIGLLRFLMKELPRVSWERVVSGPGLHNVFRYLDEDLHRPVAPAVRERMRQEDASEVIGEAGVDGSCPTCVEAVELFIKLYGSQTGNLALTALAVGGVYVGGGIVTKLLPKVTSGNFLAAFLDKAPHRALMEKTPLWVLLDPKTSQLGAAHAAMELLAS